MTIIDFHTHAFPDALAPRAIASLEAGSGDWRAVLDGRVSSLLASMDRAGIDASVVCPIATRPEQYEGILAWCLSIRSERIVPLASVHPASPRVEEEVRRVAAEGLVGLKLHPMYQDFDIDEARLDALYAAAAAENLLVVLHCGNDIAYEGSLQAHPQRVAAVARRHPTLKLVATHLGGWRMWDEVRRDLVGTPVWMETSFAASMMPPEEAVAIMRGQGVERILFGTDSPWIDQRAEVDCLRRLPLTDAEKQAILGDNAAALLAQAGQ